MLALRKLYEMGSVLPKAGVMLCANCSCHTNGCPFLPLEAFVLAVVGDAEVFAHRLEWNEYLPVFLLLGEDGLVVEGDFGEGGGSHDWVLCESNYLFLETSLVYL